MSDLSNQETTRKEHYNPTKILHDLCKGTKIEISSYADITFQIGWENLIKEFIQTIKQCPVVIYQISDHLSVFDIKFEVNMVAKEIIIWRAIQVARNQSEITCANCGENKGKSRRPYTIEMLCKSCIMSAAENGNTRTWLDKY